MKTEFLFSGKFIIFFVFIIFSSCSIFSSNKYENTIPENFIEVEKDPTVDLTAIQKCVVYPDIARRAGIEGKVIVRILLDSLNKIRRVEIGDTDNLILNDAAIAAVEKCGKFTTAIAKGKPITCWINIPITFKLTESKKD